MKAIFKETLLVLVPETDSETLSLAEWKASRDGHVYGSVVRGTGLALHDLGPQPEVCREPINVTSRHRDPEVQRISNFAVAPFELDGRHYQSVEGFWQSLKYTEGPERREVAALAGSAARRAGDKQRYGATVRYEGRDIPVGTWEHWQLMERACRAKFTQNAEARAALLATGHRPLTHKMRRDSRSIPGVIMADIWMRIRRDLQQTAGAPPAPAPQPEDEE
jgi:predicted NAD-dependent protein-ADP-ribosyltransferase YbiA (DUF1768 family)